MQSAELDELRGRLSSYQVDEEPAYWIIADKGSGATLAMIQTASPYSDVMSQLQNAGVAL